jgi:hypothetical protein
MKKTIPKEKISEFLCRPAESRIIKAEKARLATPEEILAATNYEFDV